MKFDSHVNAFIRTDIPKEKFNIQKLELCITVQLYDNLQKHSSFQQLCLHMVY